MHFHENSDGFLDGVSGSNKITRLYILFSLINKIFIKDITFNSSSVIFLITRGVVKYFHSNMGEGLQALLTAPFLKIILMYLNKLLAQSADLENSRNSPESSSNMPLKKWATRVLGPVAGLRGACRLSRPHGHCGVFRAHLKERNVFTTRMQEKPRRVAIFQKVQ